MIRPPQSSPNHWCQLAIETTGRLGSIAVIAGEQVLRRVNLAKDKRTAATLAPVIEEIIQWSRNNDSFPQFIAVADGPGSFTGLRIGITTAKTLGYALGMPVVGVDSIAAIAASVFHDSTDCQSLLVGVDAYREQVFAGKFERSTLLPPIDDIPEKWSAHPESVKVLSDAQWKESLSQRPSGTRIAGDSKFIESASLIGGATKEQKLGGRCDAVGVGLLAIRAAMRGEFVDPMQLAPRYLKRSAAEEKAASESANDGK